MILLNWLLGLGALAFTVPLAIHLLFRNRFELVDWGAMQFLQSVVRQNRRRMQLRNLLLLLIRCAIPILLAFCMARPVMTQWRQPRGDSPVSMVVVIDNSYSMAARHGDGQRRIDVALDAAKQITETLARGSEITLLTGDGLSRTADPQSARSRIDEITVGGAPLNIDGLVSRALRISSDSPLANRQIVMIVDRSAADFSQSMLDSLPGIAQRIEDVKPVPDFAWIDPFGQSQSDGFKNIRVHRVEPQTTVTVPGQSVPWFVEARIDAMELRTIELTVRINGVIDQQKTIPVTGNSATAVVPVRIDKTGRHVVEVAFSSGQEIGGDETRDDFSPDDRYWRDVAVIDPVPVWLVDGQPSDKPLASDTDFLAVALSPFSLSGQLTDPSRAADLFRTRKVRVGRLASDAASQPEPAIVVLGNVPKLTPDDTKWLIDFVQRGGTVVVFAGPSIDLQWYDQQLSTPEIGPLMPMVFGDVRQSQQGIPIDDEKLVYPPLVPFSGQERGTLASANVTQWRELVERPEAKSQVQVLIRLENSEPLFVLGEFGKGRVIQVATTSNQTWTTLPLRPVFLPLIQRLFSHWAVGRGSVAAPLAGQPLVVDGVVDGSRWTLTTPDGQTHSIVGGSGVDPQSAGNSVGDEVTTDLQAAAVSSKLVWPVVRLAGGYRFEAEDGQVIWAAVNVPPTDLKPIMVTADVVQQAAERLGVRHYAATSDFLVDDGNRRFGRSIWHLVLVALIAAMVLEPVVQQRRGRSVVA
jgi:hypothetical protein